MAMSAVAEQTEQEPTGTEQVDRPVTADDLIELEAVVDLLRAGGWQERGVPHSARSPREWVRCARGGGWRRLQDCATRYRDSAEPCLGWVGRGQPCAEGRERSWTLACIEGELTPGLELDWDAADEGEAESPPAPVRRLRPAGPVARLLQAAGRAVWASRQAG